MTQHQHAFLADTSGEIANVARRVLSMLASGDAAGAPARMAPEPDTLITLSERLFAASFDPDPQRFAMTLQGLQTEGFDNDVIAFDLIPMIARQLGAGWVDDVINFADVTIGCARLQTALHKMPEEPPALAPVYRGVRRGCLVLVPKGAQHTLGALVLARQLRQAGQRVSTHLEADGDALSGLTGSDRPDMIMISASIGEPPRGLRQLVGDARRLWPSAKVILGGSIADRDQAFLAGLNADGVTKNWQEALDLCF